MRTIDISKWSPESKGVKSRVSPRVRIGSGSKTDTAVLSTSACDLLGLEEKKPTTVQYYWNEGKLLIVKDPEGPWQVTRSDQGVNLPASMFKRHEAFEKGKEFGVEKVEVDGKDALLVAA